LGCKEIAAKLHISPHTVISHKKSVYTKKGVHNVPELILKMGMMRSGRDAPGIETEGKTNG
jgi:DNA-binding CsgD family transcriptional regulator